ncbi:hypothetical protein [Phaeodactylibacter luteus]|uniref:Uncharacterized protein n=1 Tax=Phaeodactylibacter luteus TaxID=1564516 RepID=A0A5C6RI53_9BACT|nr:hypothetical protein [Phaeodactylibacter luteus]TXB62118.1 hypothetical protein FRY97_15500 [Phaeodactylibacter luteus]
MTYFFIDDQETNQTIADNLKNENLHIIFHLVKDKWESQLSFLIDQIEEFDGLLLDWQLQGEKADSNKGYDAEALAQQIRRLASEGKIQKDFPIILCSAARNYPDVYQRDHTGHDLFDLAFSKSVFSEDEKVGQIRNRFTSLAKDYKKLNNPDFRNDLNVLLAIEDESFLDDRFTDSLRKRLDDGRGIPHEISRFIIDELLNKSGELISESILAIRLGVDISKSGEDWIILVEKLSKSKYKGLFSNGWSRWWSSQVSAWWKNQFTPNSFRRSSSKTKVGLLNDKFELSLNPIESLSDKHSSTFFWTKCTETGIPIDTSDGLLISGQENFYPWQDKRYVSIEAVTNPRIELKKPVASFERSRLESLKQKYAPKRPKR